MNAGSKLILRTPSWSRCGLQTAVSSHRAGLVAGLGRSSSSSRRTFFASSTDHTTLLSNATVHCIDGDDDDDDDDTNNNNGKKQYILLPHDTPLDLAIKVDKLHLARLLLTNQSNVNQSNVNIIHGAKVVQRTLGSKADVCKPLLDRALDDIHIQSKSLPSENNNPIALAALDGLCEWVSKAIKENEDSNNNSNSNSNSNIHETILKWKLENEEGYDYEAIKAIATGIPRPGHSVVGQGTYRDGANGWIELATLYVNESGLADEGNLYQGSGGTFVGIEYLADTSREGLAEYGGALARFEF